MKDYDIVEGPWNPPLTDDERRYEDELLKKLSELQQAFVKAAEPYQKEIARIYMRRVRIRMVVPKSDA